MAMESRNLAVHSEKLREVSVRLADDSQKLAVAARKDNKSIMTIALVMSMAFLPSASIASLVAVPWDRGDARTNLIQGVIFGAVTLVIYAVVWIIYRRADRAHVKTTK